MVLGKITQSGQTVYLLTATDIQTVIDQKEELVQNYGTIYFITIGFSIVVSNFAHELKTPLTSVIGYADMIYQKPMSREDTKNAVAYIMDKASASNHSHLS